MPQNTPQAVRSGSTSTQAIVRSDRPHWERSPKKIHHSAPSVTKLPCPRIPAPQIERIKQRHIMGQSQREIARAEGRSRPTIARIVKSEEM
jgi:DNA invertase Pin-like site-specific DNA recombinase